jgi:hypothetical protein
METKNIATKKLQFVGKRLRKLDFREDETSRDKINGVKNFFKQQKRKGTKKFVRGL